MAEVAEELPAHLNLIPECAPLGCAEIGTSNVATFIDVELRGTCTVVDVST